MENHIHNQARSHPNSPFRRDRREERKRRDEDFQERMKLSEAMHARQMDMLMHKPHPVQLECILGGFQAMISSDNVCILIVIVIVFLMLAALLAAAFSFYAVSHLSTYDDVNLESGRMSAKRHISGHEV